MTNIPETEKEKHLSWGHHLEALLPETFGEDLSEKDLELLTRLRTEVRKLQVWAQWVIDSFRKDFEKLSPTFLIEWGGLDVMTAEYVRQHLPDLGSPEWLSSLRKNGVQNTLECRFYRHLAHLLTKPWEHTSTSQTTNLRKNAEANGLVILIVMFKQVLGLR